MTLITNPTALATDDVLVTFELPVSVAAVSACVVGEFNDWSCTATPMVDEADRLVARVVLTAGRTYRFRYLLDGERWENDWDADRYVPNEFGGDDSVIDLTERSLPAADTPLPEVALVAAPLWLVPDDGHQPEAPVDRAVASGSGDPLAAA